MIDYWDVLKLFLAFFIIMPVISIIHEIGHVMIAKFLGAKNIRITMGSGKLIYNTKYLELRKYYFNYGFCYFENISDGSRWRNLIIYSGGILSNITAAVILMYFIRYGYVKSNIFTYQFLYFSLYYVFFALFPMSYPDGNYSDGKIIYHLLLNNHKLIRQHRFQLKYDKKTSKWILYTQREQPVEEWTDFEDAYNTSLSKARENRPSRLEIVKKKHTQIEIFPRNPI